MRSKSIHVLDLGDICDKEREFRSIGVSLGVTHVICLRTPTSLVTVQKDQRRGDFERDGFIVIEKETEDW